MSKNCHSRSSRSVARRCLLPIVADSLVEDAVVANDGYDRLRASALRRASVASNVIASVVSLLSVVDCSRVIEDEMDDDSVEEGGIEKASDRWRRHDRMKIVDAIIIAIAGWFLVSPQPPK